MNTQPQIEIKLTPSGNNAVAITANDSDFWTVAIKTSAPNRIERCRIAEFSVPLTELRKIARFILDTADAFEIADFEKMVIAHKILLERKNKNTTRQ